MSRYVVAVGLILAACVGAVVAALARLFLRI